VKCGETLGAMLLSWANVQFYQELMARTREAIARGELAAFAEDVTRRDSASNDTDDGDET
jgi:queuine tRNA-ribosyltransferase